MLNISNQEIYNRSLQVLNDYKSQIGRLHKGRFIQIFLGLKFYQNEIPSMNSGRFIESGVLQTMLDDLYSKNSLPSNQCVLSLFENSYLARTGIVPVGASYPSNVWRNNFNIQKGIGCYAPSNMLSSNEFLNESRSSCRYLINETPGSLRNATCSICSTGGTYRSEDHRKWLQIKIDGSGYSVVDLLNVSNFQPYIAPESNRIPILPLIIALYYDSNPGLIIGTRRSAGVDLDLFRNDFNFSFSEFSSYFDDSTSNPFNKILSDEFPELIYEPASSIHLTLSSEMTSATEDDSDIEYEPILNGNSTIPPRVHSGWEAEQFVINLLEINGWTVHDVSRQKIGYDLLAKRGRRTIFIEVKSSLGKCAPTLTSREWQQARRLSDSYILAVIEDFDPSGEQENMIYFIPNPSTINGVTSSISVNYSIPRSGWTQRVVELSRL